MNLAIVEGIFRTKKDGSKVGVYLDASNLQIKELNLDDVKRKKALERKTASVSKKRVTEKPKTETKTENKNKEAKK